MKKNVYEKNGTIKKETWNKIFIEARKELTKDISPERRMMLECCIEEQEKIWRSSKDYNQKVNWLEFCKTLTKEDMQKSHDENMRLIDKYEYLVIKKLKEQSSNRNTH